MIAILPALLLFVASPADSVVKHADNRPTVAVFPFGSSTRQTGALDLAGGVTVAVEKGLLESSRFLGVLSSETKPAIKAAILESTEPWNVESIVQAAQTNQLNAAWVLVGWISAIRISDDGKITTHKYGATVDVLVRIVDVNGGGRLVVSEQMTIDAQTEGMRKCRSLGGLARKTCVATMRNSGGFVSAEAALASAAQDAAQDIQDMLNEKLGYVLMDILGDGAEAQFVVRRTDGDPKKGAKLIVRAPRTGREGNVVSLKIGELKVDETDGENAIASIALGGDKIADALAKNEPLMVTSK